MASSEDSETASNAGSDSTWCSAPEVRNTLTQAIRIQPPRKAKRDSFIMAALCQRSCARLRTQERLCDINCLIEEHLSGKREMNAHQARSLLLELEDTLKNCKTLGTMCRKKLSTNCSILKNILADQYVKVLSEVNENMKPQFNASSANVDSQFRSDNNQFCFTVQPKLIHDLDKVSSSIIFPSGNNHLYHHVSAYELNSEYKENYQSSKERLAEDHENNVASEDQLLNKFYEVEPKTSVRDEQNLRQSVIMKASTSSPDNILTQYQQEKLLNDKDKLENRNKEQNDLKAVINNSRGTLDNPMGSLSLQQCFVAQNEADLSERSHEKRENYVNFVISPHSTVEILNIEPANVEQPELCLKQTLQTENHINELQVSSSEQKCRIKNALREAVEGEVQTVPNSFDAQLTAINMYNLPARKTNCKINYVIPTNLTYAMETNENNYLTPEIIITESSILLPSSEDFRERSLDVMIKEAEEVKMESYKVLNHSFGGSLLESKFQYLREENVAFEDDNVDLITQINEEDRMSDILIMKDENSSNVYHLTDKHLIRIAAKIQVLYEDLKLAIEDVVHLQSDGSSDGSVSIISASQSPTEKRYS